MDIKIEKLINELEKMVAYASHLTDNGIKILLEKALFDFEQEEGDEV